MLLVTMLNNEAYQLLSTSILHLFIIIETYIRVCVCIYIHICELARVISNPFLLMSQNRIKGAFARSPLISQGKTLLSWRISLKPRGFSWDFPHFVYVYPRLPQVPFVPDPGNRTGRTSLWIEERLMTVRMHASYQVPDLSAVMQWQCMGCIDGVIMGDSCRMS